MKCGGAIKCSASLIQGDYCLDCIAGLSLNMHVVNSIVSIIVSLKINKKNQRMEVISMN